MNPNNVREFKKSSRIQKINELAKCSLIEKMFMNSINVRETENVHEFKKWLRNNSKVHESK